jgi:PIN domain nuclease of toxin-antitoxin system
VVDTHALIWYLTNDKKLGNDAAQVFAAAERGETRLIVSVIVIAELYYANLKYKWFNDFNATYRELRKTPYFRFVSFKTTHVLDFDNDASIPEMHDRIIVGLARRIGAPLLSSDATIHAAKLVPLVW